ncbi:MAG: DUF4921 family protein [Aureliella sp.]
MIAHSNTSSPTRESETSSEMRHDWLADRWVIVAPQRTARPNDFVAVTPQVQSADGCPFCAGREVETPRAVASYRLDNACGDDWSVRVVPNKFPAVNAAKSIGLPELDTGAMPESAADDSIELFRRQDLSGGHEVFIESPRHILSLTELDRKEVTLVFRAYRDRLAHWLGQAGCGYAVLFKNVGLEAGASLAHSHSQLIATNIVPTEIQRTIDRMRIYERKEKTCVFTRMLENELEQQVRIVEETPDFVAFCPFASRTPSLVQIMPRKQSSQFERMDRFQIEQLAWLTHRMLRRIEKCFPDASYNFVIHTAPRSVGDASFFHWRMELFPRLTKVAGFEWGSDCYINPLTPEAAAQQLRQVGV